MFVECVKNCPQTYHLKSLFSTSVQFDLWDYHFATFAGLPTRAVQPQPRWAALTCPTAAPQLALRRAARLRGGGLHPVHGLGVGAGQPVPLQLGRRGRLCSRAAARLRALHRLRLRLAERPRAEGGRRVGLEHSRRADGHAVHHEGRVEREECR